MVYLNPGQKHTAMVGKKKNEKTKSIPKGRYLIAIDSVGVHLRKTVFVVHNGTNDEVEYQGTPLFSVKNKKLKAEIRKLIEKYIK